MEAGIPTIWTQRYSNVKAVKIQGKLTIMLGGGAMTPAKRALQLGK